MTVDVVQTLPKSRRIGYSLYRLLWSSLDLIFPPTCGGCGSSGVRWCNECHQKVVSLLPNYCPICGQKQSNDEICIQCRSNRPIFNHLRSWAVYNNEVRNAIHKLKYQRDISLAEILSRPLIEIISDLSWRIDIVVPVPLSERRKKERGYNQSAFIAFPIALALDMKYYPKALKRIRDTESQVGLSIMQRHNNVSGAFFADEKIVKYKKILIIDDVATSGATLNACAEALFSAGASDVNAITLARALYN